MRGKLFTGRALGRGEKSSGGVRSDSSRQYDLDVVGCGGCVSPKAWLELHNPASQEPKLRMFHLPNVGRASTSKK